MLETMQASGEMETTLHAATLLNGGAMFPGQTSLTAPESAAGTSQVLRITTVLLGRPRNKEVCEAPGKRNGLWLPRSESERGRVSFAATWPTPAPEAKRRSVYTPASDADSPV